MNRLGALLGLSALLLAGFVAWQWWAWEGPRVPRVVLSPVGADAPPVPGADLAPRELPDPRAAYDEIIERILFVESRRPPAADEGAAATPDEPQRAPEAAGPELLLTGVVLGGSAQPYALIRDSAGNSLRLAPDDEYLGWRVTEVAAGRLVLERNAHSETYTLRDYSRAPVAPPSANRQAFRRGIEVRRRR